VRRALIAVAVVAVTAAALNVAGVLRYPGGPLSEANNPPLWLDIPANRLGIEESIPIEVGQELYVVVYLHNRADTAVTLESLEAVDPTAGVQSVGAYRLLPGSEVYALEHWGNWPGAEPALAPFPVQLRASDSGVHQLLLVVRPTIEGDFSFSGARLRYRIGPLTFATTLEPVVTSCAHAKGGADCRQPPGI
jgi:hypothetical protein